MKKCSYLLLLILILTVSNSSAQEIIVLEERDQDGGKFVNKKNADINSQVIFKLDKHNLLKKISSFSDTTNLPSDIDELLQILTNALLKKQEWMARYAEAVSSYQTGDATGVKNFVSRVGNIAGEMLSIIRSDSKLLDYFREDESTNIWTQLTNALNKRINEIEQELLTSTKYSDIRVQMGGWLIHNGEQSPLHFNGLDTNPVGEFYEVERWRLTPTKEQLEKFESLQKLAKEDELKEANFNDIVRSKYVSAVIDELEERLKLQLDEFQTKAETIVTSLAGSPVKTDIQNIIANSKTFIEGIKSKIAFYTDLKNNPSFSITLLVTTLAKDVTDFNDAQKRIKASLEKLQSDIITSSKAIRDDVAAVDLPSMIGNLVSGLANDILGKEGLGLLTANRINNIILEFTDKVLSLSLKDIPDEPATDLRYAGFREPGDKVVVRLVIKKGEAGQQIVQETKDITLYRILPHIETTVGVIFAHPLSETDIEKEFQMAPYYNALFKGMLSGKKSQEKKRDHTLRNTILETSIGLHVSTPDFDKDDVPELGFGIAMSTLNDYLQFGGAYNIFHGTPYLFFGVRLPIGNINLGGNKNSSPADNK